MKTYGILCFVLALFMISIILSIILVLPFIDKIGSVYSSSLISGSFFSKKFIVESNFLL